MGQELFAKLNGTWLPFGPVDWAKWDLSENLADVQASTGVGLPAP